MLRNRENKIWFRGNKPTRNKNNLTTEIINYTPINNTYVEKNETDSK